ncbi:hypothetical protein PRIPAC_89677, partial [Pristionchus pacificus]
ENSLLHVTANFVIFSTYISLTCCQILIAGIFLVKSTHVFTRLPTCRQTSFAHFARIH